MIQASVVADSISESDIRITTLEAEYPRFIHSQFMTHRTFSRSASSSRARSIESVIEEAENNPVLPMVWGRNQRGMQAREVFAPEDVPALNSAWLSARDAAVNHAKRLNAMGAHKQIVNRVLEPFTHIKVVVTATEWDNFFNLRRHDDAQPEIKCLADSMWKAIYNSAPTRRDNWHLPYVLDDEREKLPEDVCLMFSVARCARVSYMAHGADAIDQEKDRKLYDMLLHDGHMSPFEHQARPNLVYGHDVRSGNFSGWQQFRKTIPGEAVYRRH